MKNIFFLCIFSLLSVNCGYAGEPSNIIIQSDRNPFYLEFKDGRPFFINGHNRFDIYIGEKKNANGWSMEQYLQEMHKHGENTLRVFIVDLNPGTVLGFEPKLGQYNQEYIKKIDELFDLCEKYQIYVILCLFDHFDLAHYWNRSPYAKENGGPAKDRTAFLTKKKALEFQEKKIEFIVKRYTGRNVLAWEVMNEINKILDQPSEDWKRICLEWTAGMADFIKKVDPNKHLVTLSLSPDILWPELYTMKNIDLVAFHTYRSVKDPLGICKTIKSLAENLAEYKKPILIAEFGSHKESPYKDEFVHNALWCALASGGVAMLWTHTKDEFGDMSEAMFQSYLGLSNFIRDVDWWAGTTMNADGRVSVSSPDIFLSALSIKDQVIFWLLDKKKEGREVTGKISIKDLDDGNYILEWYDDSNGKVIASQKITVGGKKLDLEFPPFKRHMAGYLHLLRKE